MRKWYRSIIDEGEVSGWDRLWARKYPKALAFIMGANSNLLYFIKIKKVYCQMAKSMGHIVGIIKILRSIVVNVMIDCGACYDRYDKYYGKVYVKNNKKIMCYTLFWWILQSIIIILY